MSTQTDEADDDLIVVHNHRGTYSGHTSEEVFRAAYADVLADGLSASFRRWIEHKIAVARIYDGVVLSSPFADGLDAEAVEEAFDEILINCVNVGAFGLGPAPWAGALSDEQGVIEVHNHRNVTFRGRTAKEVWRAAYAAPLAEGLEDTFEEWIEHQRAVAWNFDRVALPSPFADGLDEEGAEKAFVEILRHNIGRGALTIGPAPQDQARATPAASPDDERIVPTTPEK